MIMWPEVFSFGKKWFKKLFFTNLPARAMLAWLVQEPS